MGKAQLRDSWTAYAAQQGLIGSTPAEPPKPAKYHNVKVMVDGHTFDSKKEAARFQELKFMLQAKLIADLELQPIFPLHVMRLYRSIPPITIATVGIFTADFRYTDLSTGEIITEDVKSKATKNTAYKLRKAIAEAVHGITVKET